MVGMVEFPSQKVTPQHNQFSAGLSRFDHAGTRGCATQTRACYFLAGNPLMNDAQLSQTAGKAKMRQPGHLVKPTQIVLRSYLKSSLFVAAAGRSAAS